MKHLDLSITTMEHHILSRLEPAPFDDLHAEGMDGTSFYGSLNTFRRLYNDAVETAEAYRSLSKHLEDELEEYRNRCNELEQTIRELTDN